jgi:nicotinamide-nucleotide amidase
MADRMMQELAARLGTGLAATGSTLAVAESCTGGALSAAITGIPGSSGYFLGGVVAYHNSVKTRELGVPEELIGSAGAVSEQVALAMAEGVRRRFGARIGVGITGIAGPGGGTEEKPVGTVCLGISVGAVRHPGRRRFPGDRESVRRQAVAWALAELVQMSPGGPGKAE